MKAFMDTPSLIKLRDNWKPIDPSPIKLTFLPDKFGPNIPCKLPITELTVNCVLENGIILNSLKRSVTSAIVFEYSTFPILFSLLAKTWKGNFLSVSTNIVEISFDLIRFANSL